MNAQTDWVCRIKYGARCKYYVWRVNMFYLLPTDIFVHTTRVWLSYFDTFALRMNYLVVGGSHDDGVGHVVEGCNYAKK